MTETLHARRTEQAGRDWQADYALRCGVEGTIRQVVATTGARRARYRGLDKTRLEHLTGACALNLHRLDAWWNDRALDRSHISHLARLEIHLASERLKKRRSLRLRLWGPTGPPGRWRGSEGWWRLRSGRRGRRILR
jgi:hypothetical protein